jgi:hypothetical protein
MYPNDNNNSQPLSVNYLDQIAPQPTSRKFGPLDKQHVIIGGIIAFILLIIISAICSLLLGGVNQTVQLASRLVNTKTIATDASSKIANSQLRALNGSLKASLTNTIRDIKPALAKSNINVDKLDKKLLAIENDKKMLDALEDARLNAVYDRVYAREMAYKLATTINLMQQIEKSSSKDFKQILETAYTNLEPIQKQFEDFNAANS